MRVKNIAFGMLAVFLIISPIVARAGSKGSEKDAPPNPNATPDVSKDDFRKSLAKEIMIKTMENFKNSDRNLIRQHVESYIGYVAGTIHESHSIGENIDILVVEPTDENPYFKMITSGMSDIPMTIPEGFNVQKYIELMITLPNHWKLDFQDENWFWPIGLLRTLAKFPHKTNNFLGYGQTIDNGPSCLPYSENTKLCGAILLPPYSHYQEFSALQVNEEKTIHFYSLVPLYKEEIEYRLKNGGNEFITKLNENNFRLEVDINRPIINLD